jgi:hypothetical protein
MPEASEYNISFKEFAEHFVKVLDIHEGLWGIQIKFGLGAANVGTEGGGTALPTALVPVREIGLRRYDEPSNLTVDAAEVNPAPKATSKETGTKATKATK